jgi:hypothetical protein
MERWKKNRVTVLRCGRNRQWEERRGKLGVGKQAKRVQVLLKRGTEESENTMKKLIQCDSPSKKPKSLAKRLAAIAVAGNERKQKLRWFDCQKLRVAAAAHRRLRLRPEAAVMRCQEGRRQSRESVKDEAMAISKGRAEKNCKQEQMPLSWRSMERE